MPTKTACPISSTPPPRCRGGESPQGRGYSLIRRKIRLSDNVITLTVTQAARDFSNLVNRIRYQGEEATLLKAGRPVARMVPVPSVATGAQLARLWPALARLGAKEAARLEAEQEAVKRSLPQVQSKWD